MNPSLKTPIANRPHIAVFGNTNAGKSTLFNMLAGSDIAIVSDQKGTTTDPVIKAVEMLPFGPAALIDTAGLDDSTGLGGLRIKKSLDILKRASLIIYAADLTCFDRSGYSEFLKTTEEYSLPVILVFTKSDLVGEDVKADFSREFPKVCFISKDDRTGADNLKKQLSAKLQKLEDGNEISVIGSLLSTPATVIMVVPIDSGAPKGRLILPQVQLIRECLDHGIKALVVRDSELKEAVSSHPGADLVVTDSQVFGFVAKNVPESIKITSFSMLLAAKSGRMKQLIDGAGALDTLKIGARILFAEACSHFSTHEDIGRKKIPQWLDERYNRDFVYEYSLAHTFPEDISGYDMIIHCGGCMINSREMTWRLKEAAKTGVPITNYGVLIAKINGILDRASEIFR